jgi:histidine triad (HIT) family protein
MYNHAPENYVCPICIAINNKEHVDSWIVQDDIFYRDDVVMGFINSKTIKGNDGHPLIVPVEHVENIYDLPTETAHRISEVAKQTALALKQTRKADGVTIIQNNEPAGDQHAFHYHLHLVPRFDGDAFHKELWETKRSKPEDRTEYAAALRKYFKKKK